MREKYDRRTFLKATATGIAGTAAMSGSVSAHSVGLPCYTNTDLNIREGPGTDYAVKRTALENTGMLVVDGPVESDGYTWWKFRVNGDANDPNRYTGWAVQQYAPAADFGYGSYDYITATHGDGRDHSGVDMAHTDGGSREITAARGGTVSHTGEISGYGNTVIVDHEGAWDTLYAHLSEYEVSQGESVDRRQLIGWTGDTGNSTGIHLHQEVRYDGTPQTWPATDDVYLWADSGIPKSFL
ncbi:M23 family metallopeptidase [Halorussus salilacus]|uniref:M23 family metallopeptidase n=1 Tax=Halorussus salilacus TaxID=2953750 RepID=UPI00209E0C8A|nr:M23 family metallopeptidase [Halorussus salilacus]USZ67984.1 M23 family metallopeptidase [Halorussus salilacus]